MHTQFLLASAENTTTVSFSNGLSAIIVILALYGVLSLFGLSDEKSYLRLAVIFLIVGVLFVNIQAVASLGAGLRRGVNSLLATLHLSEFTSDLVLFVVLVLVLIYVFTRHQRARGEDNKWMGLTILVAFVLMTVSIVSTAVLWITTHAADILGWLQQANF